jgi:hypothetical protein
MRWIVGLLMLWLATAPARAEPLPDGGVTAQEVAGVLQRAWYKAESTKDTYGDPLIKSTSSSVNFSVYFYTRKNSPRCTSIQFYAGFQKPGVAPEQIAEWNRTTRFGEAYLDQDGDLRLEMDMDVEHGANTEALKNDLDR